MPQTVTLDPGSQHRDDLTIDDLESGELGFLVEAADRSNHSRAVVGEPVMRLGPMVKFFTSGLVSDNMDHRVRRMRPGERVVFEAAPVDQLLI